MRTAVALLAAAALCPAAQDQGEMFATPAGMLAITTPEGFERRDGAAPIWFVPKGSKTGGGFAAIYVTPVKIGEGTPFPSLAKFIEDDVRQFRKRFARGKAMEASPLTIPHSGVKAPAWTFQSGEKHSAFERLVFLEEGGGLVWLLVLTADSEARFHRNLPIFESFAKSYKGTIQLGL